MDLIALAVPFFFALIALELFVARRRKRELYRFGDALTDLSCGISSQIPLAFWGAVEVGAYVYVYERWRVATVGSTWIAIAIAFVGVDFLYYWWHRASHEVNFLWAAHVVHHQSEDYNLAVALRQAVLTSWTGIPFYLPLAMLGVPATVFVPVHALSTLYQFWIHTELVGHVGGPIGFLFNMPEHHRVHHAVNARYLDKNYGATLIVWDRLFKTFEPEVEPCVYGTTTQLASFNPAWAQVEQWAHLARGTLTLRGVDRLTVWLRSPAWKPAYATPATIDVHARRKYDPPVKRSTRRYVGVQHALIVVGTFLFLLFHSRLGPAALWLSSAALLLGLVSLGGLLEARRWARVAE
ncbi:MAG TPA: sterol desaturase family protein, partial [Byssovorax sp.]